jgi:hypothetical protein
MDKPEIASLCRSGLEKYFSMNSIEKWVIKKLLEELHSLDENDEQKAFIIKTALETEEGVNALIDYYSDTYLTTEAVAA